MLAAGRFTVGSVLEEQADILSHGNVESSSSGMLIDQGAAFEAGLRLIVDDAQDKRFQDAVVTIVELLERLRFLFLDAMHQLQIRRSAGFQLCGCRRRSRRRGVFHLRCRTSIA